MGFLVNGYRRVVIGERAEGRMGGREIGLWGLVGGRYLWGGPTWLA